MNRRTYAACMYGCMHVREAWAWQDAPRLPCRRRLASCAWCTTPSPLTCRRHASTPCRTCERGSQVQLCMWVDVCMCVCTRAYAGTCASTQVPEFAYVCTCILAYALAYTSVSHTRHRADVCAWVCMHVCMFMLAYMLHSHLERFAKLKESHDLLQLCGNSRQILPARERKEQG